VTPAGARVVVAFTLIAGAWALPARADTQEAVAAMKAGRYLEAAAELQAVVDQSPGYADGYFLLGHCMLKMGRTRDAELEFRRALRLDPGPAVYYAGLALALAASGNWPHAIRSAGEGLARTADPRMRYTLLALRGYALSSLRRWNDAIQDLEAAQSIRSQTWLLVFLGKARFATGAYAEAIQPLRQVLQVLPDDPVVLRLLAECFLRLAAAEPDAVRKQFGYVQSLTYAQRLASVTPDDLDAVHLVGRAALGAGRLDQAENVFRHVLAVNPRQCYALADLGRTYMAAARWEEAMAYLRTASACAPRLTAVWESLGDLYLELGQPQEAAAAFRRVEEIEPTQSAPEFPTTIPVFQPR
jgi:tetratricopeptide (TPR) repeat protein